MRCTPLAAARDTTLLVSGLAVLAEQWIWGPFATGFMIMAASLIALPGVLMANRAERMPTRCPDNRVYVPPSISAGGSAGALFASSGRQSSSALTVTTATVQAEWASRALENWVHSDGPAGAVCWGCDKPLSADRYGGHLISDKRAAVVLWHRQCHEEVTGCRSCQAMLAELGRRYAAHPERIPREERVTLDQGVRRAGAVKPEPVPAPPAAKPEHNRETCSCGPCRRACLEPADRAWLNAQLALCVPLEGPTRG